MSLRSPWLWRPAADLALGAGLLTLPLLFLIPYLLSTVGVTGTLLIQLAALLCNYPHYAATLLRISRQKGGEDNHPRVMVLGGVVGLVLLLFSLSYSHFLIPFFTLYMLWSPYHYAGQNYGIALLFLKRRGIAVPVAVAQQLKYGFHLSTLIAWVFIQQKVNSSPYLIQIQLPEGAGVVFALTLLVAQLTLWARALYSLKRGGSSPAWHLLLPTAAVLVVQCVWFSAFALTLALPSWRWLPQRLGMAEVAFMHCAQYLWIYAVVSTEPQSSCSKSPGDTVTSSPGSSCPSRAQLWAETCVVGALLWILLPWCLSRIGSFDLNRCVLAATVFINLHHFVLDGLIWRLRKPQVQASLGLASAANGSADMVASPLIPTPITAGRGGKTGGPVLLAGLKQLRPPHAGVIRAQWGLAAAAAVGIGVLDLTYRYHQLSSAPADVNWALQWNPYHSGLQTTRGIELIRAGRAAEAEPFLRRAVELDTMNPTAWHNLGLYLAAPEPMAAIACFERAVELRPDQRDSWRSLGILLQQQHDPRAAHAFEQARTQK